MSDSVWPHRQQPTRLHHSWDSPGKNTGMGCHFLPQCMKVKSESEVAQPCPALRDPMDCHLPGFSAHGIFQARVLEWVAISFSRRSSQSKDWTQVSHIVGRRFTIRATREHTEANYTITYVKNTLERINSWIYEEKNKSMSWKIKWWK